MRSSWSLRPSCPDRMVAPGQQMLMMLPMLAGSVAMALMYTSYRTGPLMYVTGGLFGLSAVGMLGSQFLFAGGQNKQDMLAARRDYLRTWPS